MVGTALYWMRTPEKPAEPVSSSIESAPVLSAAPAIRPAQPAPSQPPGTRPKPVSQKFPTVASTVPRIDRQREEIQKNPHGPSSSTIEFSVGLENRYEASVKSPELRAQFFNELEDCVLKPEESGDHPIEALCLDQARRLSEVDSNLKTKYAQIIEKADPKTVSLARRLQ